jgi:MFS superfamily sulfate permease-like transporter
MKLRYYVPAMKWIPSYTWHFFLSDLLAGVTVAFFMIPAALSYATTIVKVPVQHGLFTAIYPLCVYTIFGMSRQLSVGPEAVVALLTASAINQYTGDADVTAADEEQRTALRVSAMASLTLLVGLFTSLLGFFRLGFLDSVLSRSLLRGFISAVAVVVVIEQLPPLFGISYSELPKNGTMLVSCQSDGMWRANQVLGPGNLPDTSTMAPPERLYSLAGLGVLDFGAGWAGDRPATTTNPDPSTTSFDAPQPTDPSSSTSFMPLPTEAPEPEEPPPPTPPAVSPPELTPLEKLNRFLKHVKNFHPQSTLIALCTACFLFVARFVKQRFRHISAIALFPDILFTLAVADILSFFLYWEADGVRVVGPVEAGLEFPGLPSLGVNRVRNLFITAVLISIIGFVESVAVTSHYSAITNEHISPNRELVALGLSNVLGSAFGAWPAFGSLPRSGVAYTAGAKSQMFALIAAVVVLLTALFLSSVMAFLPIPALAGVITGWVSLRETSRISLTFSSSTQSPASVCSSLKTSVSCSGCVPGRIWRSWL